MLEMDIELQKHAYNPVHRCTVDGAQCTVYHPRVIVVDGTYHMYYAAVHPDGLTRIHLATSTDLHSWTDHPGNPVLDVGEQDWESHRVTYPFVIREAGKYHMCYTGMSRRLPYRIGMAVSDDLVHWRRYGGNPVIDAGGADANEAHTPCIIRKDGVFHMLYAGADSKGIHRVLLATSPDLLTWTKYPGNPVIDVGPEGCWDREYAGLPSVVKLGETYVVFYTGQPVLNRETEIGMAWSSDLIRWTKRPRSVLRRGGPGEWDSEFVGQGGAFLDPASGNLCMTYIGRAPDTPYAIGLAVGTFH